ncbi:hypothetical protein [uncultured Apibacter sp.]|uniref:hypothetical protein n=1 Tax=uncultured Apibacter sp. TaxID=1778616 RepID=UPI0025E28F7C|nr:hypothetical protein [uncultured Apibacter sp.]
MSSYLPEKTYVVCTNQTGNGYRELLADSEKRKVSVFYQENRAFLTIIDKKLNEDFTCKTGWSKGLSVGTFRAGAGIGVGVGAAAIAPTIGAMLGSAAVASAVPILGWIVGGAIALAAVGYALYKIFTNPKCIGALGNEASQWKLYHPKVYKNKYNAILSCSILQCGEGGILLPFISQTAAAKAASTIGWNNKADIGLNVVVNGLAGYGLGFSVMGIETIGGGIMFALSTGLAIYLGENVINPSAQWVGDKYAERYKSKRYDEVRNSIEKKPAPDKGLLDYVMGANNPAKDISNMVKNKNQIVEAMKANGASKEAIANFEASVAEAQRIGTLSNSESAKVLSDIKEGKYGSDVKDIFTNRSGNARGMHTQRNYDKATQMEQDKIQLNKYKSLKEAKKGAGSLLAIAQPFISAIFDRKVLIKAIEIQEAADAEDFSNSISVISTDY